MSIAKTIYKVFDVRCTRVYYGYMVDKTKNRDIITSVEDMQFFIMLERPLCISNLGNSLTTVFTNSVTIGKGFGNPYYVWINKMTEHGRVLWDPDTHEFKLEPLSFNEIEYICKKKSDENRKNPSLCSIM